MLLAALALATVASAAGYYLPGTYPQEFYIGQQLQGETLSKMRASLLRVMQCACQARCTRFQPVCCSRSFQCANPAYALICCNIHCLPAAEVNSLTSAETELPFDYYSLPFCGPSEGVKKSLNSINPGTILMGSRIQNSPYNYTMLVMFHLHGLMLLQA